MPCSSPEPGPKHFLRAVPMQVRSFSVARVWHQESSGQSGIQTACLTNAALHQHLPTDVSPRLRKPCSQDLANRLVDSSPEGLCDPSCRWQRPVLNASLSGPLCAASTYSESLIEISTRPRYKAMLSSILPECRRCQQPAHFSVCVSL